MPGREMSVRQPRERLLIVLALLALYLVWGSTYLAMRFAIEGFPPFMMAGLRFLIAGAVLYAFLRLRGVPAPGFRQWAASAAVGGLLLLGGNGGVAFAEQWIASGTAALAIATVPLWTVLFSGLWGNWPARRELIGILIGLAGVALLNLGGNMQASALGAAVLLAAAASWAFGSAWSRRLPMPMGLMSSAAQMLMGGCLLMAASFAAAERLTALPSAKAIWALAFLIVFGSWVAFSAYLYLLETVRPALATSYAYVNPVVAVALGAALAGETIGVMEVMAMPVILAGVVMVMLKK